MTSRIIARLTAEPWLIQAEGLETIIQIAARDMPDAATLAAWKNDPAREALATRPGDRLGNAPSARVRDGVAIVPVAGPIFRYANLFTSFSGASALSDLAENMQAAISDSRVRAILLEIDSPGGEVTGLNEAAALIAQAAALKPTVAYVEGSAMSAAYWLASAASEIVLSSTAAVGSLGAVVAMRVAQEDPAKSGRRTYRFVSSQTPNKLFDPATDSGAARVQAFADRIAAEFLVEAATNRGMSVADLLTASDGGGVLVGSDAVDAGLADSIAGFEATLTYLAAGLGKTRAPRTPQASRPATPGPTPRASIQEPVMTTAADAPAPAPDPVAPAIELQAAAAPPPVDLVAAERSRCAAIQTAAQPGFGALAALAIDKGWPLEDFTAAQAASASAVEGARAEAAGTAFRDSLPAPLAGGGSDADQPQDVESKAKAEWSSSAAIRAEFGTEGALVAYRRAEADGKVRAIPRKRA
jgi:capsid assembly protease